MNITCCVYLPVHVLDLDDLAKSPLAKGGQDSICNSEELKLINSFERRLLAKLWEGKNTVARGLPSDSRLEGTTFLFACLAGAQDNNSKLKSLASSSIL